MEWVRSISKLAALALHRLIGCTVVHLHLTPCTVAQTDRFRSDQWELGLSCITIRRPNFYDLQERGLGFPFLRSDQRRAILLSCGSGVLNFWAPVQIIYRSDQWEPDIKMHWAHSLISKSIRKSSAMFVFNKLCSCRRIVFLNINYFKY